MQHPLQKNLTELFTDLKRYLLLRVEVFKLIALESTAKIIADIISNSIMVCFAVLAFLAGAVTLALYFSSLTGSYAGGFGCATAFFVFVALLLVWKRSAFDVFIAGVVVNRYFEKHCEDEREEESEC